MRSIFFFSLIVVLGIGMFYIVMPFLYPIFWAAVIAVMFYPLYRWINKHLKMKKVSAGITLLLVIVVLFLPLLLLTGLLINESVKLYVTASEANFFSNVETATSGWVASLLGPYLDTIQTEWTARASSITQSIAGFLLSNLRDLTQSSLRFVFMFFIMLYTLYYFLKDGPRMLKRLMHLSPLGDKYEAMLYTQFTSTTRATLKSTIIVGGIQGALGGILFWLTGMEGAFVWGVVMVILAIIPAIGPTLVLFPAAVIVLATGGVWQAVTLAIGALLISVIDNIIRPPLVGKDIQMHPLIVLFATLGGLVLFGISGFVIGPIIAALFIAIMQIYDHYYRNELENN